MKIKQIFDEISRESYYKGKIEILTKYKDNELLKRVIYLADSPRVKFYIKQIPEYVQLYTDPIQQEELCDSIEELLKLSNRAYTGSSAIKFLRDILDASSPEDAYIIIRIIDKDCKIGMGTTFYNKVFPDLIEETPYMGAISFNEAKARALFENGGWAYSDIKMDGRYCNGPIMDGIPRLESRQGEPTIVTGAKFFEELKRFPNIVLTGELTIPGIPRYISNGIISSIVDICGKADVRSIDETEKKLIKFEKEHKCTFDDSLSKIVYTVWDAITHEEYAATESHRPYTVRKTDLAYMLKDAKCENVILIESKPVYSYAEAIIHFQSALERGEEGTILKASDGKWKDGKPAWQIKMKLEMDVDLKIVGFNYGTKGTKNENFISSLNAESSDGLVKTKPQGLKEVMMKYITENQDKLLGTIVETTCSGLSHDSNMNYSLLHPRFKKLRDDKNTCDDLPSIMRIEEMAKALK